MNSEPTPTLKLKPLHIRLRQRYYTWRQNTLSRIGICPGCGWRRHRGEYACTKCYWENWPT